MLGQNGNRPPVSSLQKLLRLNQVLNCSGTSTFLGEGFGETTISNQQNLEKHSSAGLAIPDVLPMPPSTSFGCLS